MANLCPNTFHLKKKMKEIGRIERLDGLALVFANSLNIDFLFRRGPFLAVINGRNEVEKFLFRKTTNFSIMNGQNRTLGNFFVDIG